MLSERHALFVGSVLGLAMRNGLHVTPVADDDGNYTDQMVIDFDRGLRVTVVVPPPPDDWSFENWLSLIEPQDDRMTPSTESDDG